MITQEKKLGRGLSALLGESKAKTNNYNNFPSNADENQGKNQQIVEISVNKITAGIYQPRRNFNQDELSELANSIRENGLIQPIVLRKADDGEHYEIIAGERRFRATKLLGLTKIAAIVKKINNHEALEMALVENIQRSDLSFIEEAKGYQQLIHDFSYTQDQIAKKTGKSRSHIANILRLLSLPKDIQQLLDKKTISLGHAKILISAKNPEEIVKKITQDSLSVRETEDLVHNQKIENIKNNPVLTRSETKTKFINSAELVDFENKLSQLLDAGVKISYNQFKNKGKLTINFEGFEVIDNLIKRLEY